MANKIKYYLTFILAGALLLIALQNMAPTELNFLFWSFQASRIIVILLALLLGFLVGWIAGTHMRDRNDTVK